MFDFENSQDMNIDELVRGSAGHHQMRFSGGLLGCLAVNLRSCSCLVAARPSSF
jgi:hypothetical protein